MQAPVRRKSKQHLEGVLLLRSGVQQVMANSLPVDCTADHSAKSWWPFVSGWQQSGFCIVLICQGCCSVLFVRRARFSRFAASDRVEGQRSVLNGPTVPSENDSLHRQVLSASFVRKPVVKNLVFGAATIAWFHWLVSDNTVNTAVETAQATVSLGCYPISQLRSIGYRPVRTCGTGVELGSERVKESFNHSDLCASGIVFISAYRSH